GWVDPVTVAEDGAEELVPATSLEAGAQVQQGLEMVSSPAHRGGFEAQVHDAAHRALDHAGADGQGIRSGGGDGGRSGTDQGLKPAASIRWELEARTERGEPEGRRDRRR